MCFTDQLTACSKCQSSARTHVVSRARMSMDVFYCVNGALFNAAPNEIKRQQEAQLLLEKADRTAYVRSSSSDFQSQKQRFLTGDTVSSTLC